MIRHPKIVMTKVRDPFSSGQSKSAIVWGRLVPGIDRQIFPAKTGITKRGGNFLGIVGTTVADNQQLEISESLGLRTEKRITKNAAPVVGRDDDANRGASPSIFIRSAPKRVLEAIRNDVVVHRQPINVRISMIISPCRHADEQGICSP